MFERGDIFCTRNLGSSLCLPIKVAQGLRNPTGTGDMTHAGILLDKCTTYESLGKVKRQNIFEAYGGSYVVVGRFKEMTDERFAMGWAEVKKYEGKWYPLPRLLMFMLLPITTKYFAPSRIWGFGFFADVVCSELAGRFAKYADVAKYNEVCGFKQFRGLMPAHLADRIRRWESISIVWDNILPQVALDG